MKIQNILLTTLVYSALILSHAAHSQVSNDSPITPVDSANLWCGQKGGGFYFDTINEKAWQGDPGEPDALELTIVKFEKMRCPGCFNIQADLYIFGSVIKWDLQLRGKAQSNGQIKIELKSVGTTNEDEDDPIEIEYNCVELK